jgi:hypothetical protein
LAPIGQERHSRDFVHAILKISAMAACYNVENTNISRGKKAADVSRGENIFAFWRPGKAFRLLQGGLFVQS